MQNLLVTGGAGFIGSNFVHHVLADAIPTIASWCYDKLTYAGNLDNLKDVAADPRYAFVQGDICDGRPVERAMREHQIDTIVNFAAETPRRPLAHGAGQLSSRPMSMAPMCCWKPPGSSSWSATTR